MRRVAFVSAWLIFAASVAGWAEERPTAPVAVVVGVSSHVTSIDADTLRDLFLRRRLLLEDGAKAVPINLPVGDALRERFSILVLGRKPAELSAYWDRLYFDGVRPPIVLPSAEAVRRYLQIDPHAIGYLAPEAVDATLRVLVVFPAGGQAPTARR